MVWFSLWSTSWWTSPPPRDSSFLEGDFREERAGSTWPAITAKRKAHRPVENHSKMLSMDEVRGSLDACLSLYWILSVLSVISGALEWRSCDDLCLFVPAAMGLQMFYSKTATPELYNQAAAAAGGGMIRSHRARGGHTNHQTREVATPVLPRPVPVCVSSSWWLEKYDDLSSWAAPDQCAAAWSIVALQVLHSWSAWALINHVWPFCDLLCLLQTVELCVPICCMKCEKKVREAVLDMDGMVRHQARRISS